jgi:hypothetical protein
VSLSVDACVAAPRGLGSFAKKGLDCILAKSCGMLIVRVKDLAVIFSFFFKVLPVIVCPPPI